MSFQNYLQENQKLVYQTFVNSLNNNRLSHAYLLTGNEGTPLLETALFLAKSLLCPEKNPLACENCLTCLRFDEGNYADFKLLNGQEKNIKVSDIEELQSFFQNTPSEKSGIMIYIIHALENSNRESLNALLKFLEEPQNNVYAFITTFNEERLLPTILSRTQHLKLLPLKKEELLQEIISEGISEDDAEIMIQFYGDKKTILQIINNQNFLRIKDLVFDTLDQLIISPKASLYFVESKIIPELKDKNSVRLYLDILSCAFKDIMNVKYNLPLSIKSQEQTFSALAKIIDNPQEIYKEIILSRGKIETNVNLSLLLEHIFIFINHGGQ